MAVSPLATVWIPSLNYHEGRLRPVRGICLHTAQTPCEAGRAVGILRFLAPVSAQASSHYAVDPEVIGAGVDELNTAWAAPGFNSDGIQIEQAGFAEFGSGLIDRIRYPQWFQYYGGVWPEWTDPQPQKMIREKTVPLLVDICRRNNIPATALTPAGLQSGARGITHHIWCTEAFGGSHWDCGPNFPIEQVITLVAAQLLGVPTTPSTTEDDSMKLVYSDNGAIYFVGGNSKAEVVGQPATPGGPDAWTNTKWGLDRLIEFGVIDEVVNPAPGPNNPKGGVPQGALNCIPDK